MQAPGVHVASYGGAVCFICSKLQRNFNFFHMLVCLAIRINSTEVASISLCANVKYSRLSGLSQRSDLRFRSYR